MSLNRWRVNFEGNERIDLPDFRSMMARAFADFDLLVKTYIDNEAAPRTLRRYQEGTHSANTFQLRRDLPRGLQSSSQEWLYVNSDAAGSVVNLELASNTTNYVQVRIFTSNDDLQTRAFWETDVGLTGEEFFDEINVRTRMDEEFSVTQTGFGSPAQGWIPLYTVVTNASGAITAISRQDDFFWKNRSFTLPAATARSTVFQSAVTDLRSFIDFLGALMSEVKGSGLSFESAPWSTIKLLREYQNIFYTGGGDVSFGVAASNTLRFTQPILVNIAGRGTTYSLGALGNNDYSLQEGQCLYVKIPDDTTSTLTAEIGALGELAINPTSSGYSPNIMVLFFRTGNKLYGTMEIPDLSIGETAEIGQDLSNTIRSRLGITGENSFSAYTSLVNISSADSYPEAISKLDAAVATLQALLPQEENFAVGSDGQSAFTCSEITFHPAHVVADIVVYVNGVKQRQDTDGLLAEDFRKVGTDEIEFSYTLPENALVTIRKERPGGGAGGGGATDLTNAYADIQPDTNGGKNLGSDAKGWGAIFLRDTMSPQVYRIDIQSGTIVVTPV